MRIQRETWKKQAEERKKKREEDERKRLEQKEAERHTQVPVPATNDPDLKK